MATRPPEFVIDITSSAACCQTSSLPRPDPRNRATRSGDPEPDLEAEP